jgi:hypothetical protein
MRLPLVLLAALMAVCAAHPAAAAGPASLDATLAGVLIDGQLTLAGPLAALASTGHVDPSQFPSITPPPNDLRLAPTSLRLAAHRLHAETDLQRQLASPAVGLPQPEREFADFADAVAHTTAAREKFQFYLAPLPGHDPPTARLDAVQARLQPTAAAAVEPERKVSSGRALLAPAPGPAAVVSGGLRTLHVEGDFVLTLWEWDLAVSSEGVLLRSGYSYTPLAPSVNGVDTAGNSEERQVFLTAEGAALDITLPYDAAITVALQPTLGAFDGRFVLERPSGHLVTLAGDQPLHDGDWVDGAFHATFSNLAPGSFRATLDGTGRQAHLAGLTTAIAAPLPSVTGALVATLAASGIAILGSWRLWGRRSAALPVRPTPAAPGLEGDDELRALRWLEARAGAAEVLWDSDLMRAFDWSAERAQDALRALQAKGQVRCKDVALAPGRSSMGHIALTAAGVDRLRAGPAATPERRTGLRRLGLGR